MVALATSLSLKASNTFPDLEFLLENGPNSEVSGRSEKSGKSENFVKPVIFLSSVCCKRKNTLCVKISSKMLLFEEIRAISIYKVLTMKKWSQI